MTNKIRISDLDFVYISFKEPNREQNWADLKNKVPWAKRVDGVVGFDNAHKAAANMAETDFFISVDGDNTIDEIIIASKKLDSFSIIAPIMEEEDYPNFKLSKKKDLKDLKKEKIQDLKNQVVLN